MTASWASAATVELALGLTGAVRAIGGTEVPAILGRARRTLARLTISFRAEGRAGPVAALLITALTIAVLRG